MAFETQLTIGNGNIETLESKSIGTKGLPWYFFFVDGLYSQRSGV